MIKLKVAGLTVGELISLISFVGVVIGFVIRFALIAPLKNMIQSLDQTLQQLREDMQESKNDLRESKEDRADIRVYIQKVEADLDKRISIIETERNELSTAQIAQQIVEEIKRGGG
ncbi:hypothetical protein [Listeria costaricensis]|uniref:hypothetical protein n=1 Tax=Listeria costaricensis TaxID=2026604 RepID=UPI000C079F7A|nr:hypothetical protein [Listeria costaricensis]